MGRSHDGEASFELLYNRPYLVEAAVALAAEALLGAGNCVEFKVKKPLSPSRI